MPRVVKPKSHRAPLGDMVNLAMPSLPWRGLRSPWQVSEKPLPVSPRSRMRIRVFHRQPLGAGGGVQIGIRRDQDQERNLQPNFQ